MWVCFGPSLRALGINLMFLVLIQLRGLVVKSLVCVCVCVYIYIYMCMCMYTHIYISDSITHGLQLLSVFPVRHRVGVLFVVDPLEEFPSLVAGITL